MFSEFYYTRNITWCKLILAPKKELILNTYYIVLILFMSKVTEQISTYFDSSLMIKSKKKLLAFFIFSLVTVFSTHAQFKGAYHIGSLGSMGLQQRVFTGPVVINDSSCFTISNGVSTLKHHTNINAFRLNCELMLVEAPVIMLIPYPNPSTTHVIIKSAVSIPFQKKNPGVQLELFDLSGRVLKTYQAGLMDLNSGYQISLSQLANGPYFIRVAINSVGFAQTLKILKAN